MKRQGIGGWRQIAMLAASAAALAACARTEDPELGWARAALERNPDIEVIAVDSTRKVFTVRDRTADRLYTVAMNDLVAGPAAMMHVATPETAPSEAAPSAETDSTRQDAASGAVSPEESPPASEPVLSAAVPAESEAQAAARPPDYTVERSGGKVRVSGPGISIVSADSTGQHVEPGARSVRHDAPIICEGSRMMHIDDRTLDVDGDAVIARDGCDLYLTNSHIRASGTAITATRARVHIANSTVAGGTRSLEVGDGGEAFLRNSTLDGVASRLGSAQLHDLGGNRWE